MRGRYEFLRGNIGAGVAVVVRFTVAEAVIVQGEGVVVWRPGVAVEVAVSVEWRKKRVFRGYIL